jgi:hypothetical protein
MRYVRRTTARVALTLALLAPSFARAQSRCGVDRWPVKVWEDADAALVDTTPVTSTVSALAGLDIPEVRYPTNGRLAPVERQVFRLRAEIARITTEEDGDWHVILRDPDDGRRAIIAEVPDPRCVKSPALQQIYTAVRDSLRRVPRRGIAVVHGIGFWDFLHTQEGGAPNGIELHPLLLVIPVRESRR